MKFEILGDAVGKGRPRVVYRKSMGRAVALTPEKTENWEAFVKMTASEAMKEYKQECFGKVPLIAFIDVYKTIPKSWSKKKRELAFQGKIRPVTKPDNDNIEKSIFDACNGVVYQDDSCIVSNSTNKFYTSAYHPSACVVVEFREVF